MHRLRTCALLVCVGATVVHSPSAGADDELSEEDKALLEQAEADADAAGEVIEVRGEKPYIPVASDSVRDRDFLLRPHPRPADILRVVPGLLVGQHAGGGKANQYFLRGFDADHGTDVALGFDGVPANMVSHGHGQGYADLNWVIPEVVSSVDTFKGPYSVLHGDFATAGAIQLVTHDKIEQSSLSLTGGLFDTYRGLAILSAPRIGRWDSYAAIEGHTSDGPFENPDDYRRGSAYAKARGEVGATSAVEIAIASYTGDWHGSGQIPLREVEAGRLDPFGSLDPSEGGKAQRHTIAATYESFPDHRSEIAASAFVGRTRLSLFSNFTFFSADPVDGDQIEQTDDRWLAGAGGHYRFRRDLGSVPVWTTVGVQTRGDVVDNGISTAREREARMPTVDATVREASAGVFAQADVAWTPWLRTVTGARADTFWFDVDDHLDDASSGSRAATRISPKGSLVVSPTRTTDLYANVGLGFHSNDARAVVRDDMAGTPLARAVGYELGSRSRIADRVDLAGSLWLLDLASETVWVGDEGITEARGRSRRMGVELEARAKILSWLFADLDVTAARARFRDLPGGENLIPLAPRYTVSGGLSVQHSIGVFGRAGMRALSDRPLTEDGFLTAEGYELVDLSLGYRTRRYEVSIAIDNLLDREWRETQFATTSRLSTEASTMAPPAAGACPAGTRVGTDATGNFAGCDDVHFTPGTPFNAMLTARAFF